MSTRLGRVSAAWLAASLALAACEGGSGSSKSETSGGSAGDAGVDVRSQVLAELGDGIIVPALQEFSQASHGLAQAVASYGVALASDPSHANAAAGARAQAQAALVTAASAWQVLEVMQVGPAASSIDDPGGRDLRDEIYSWPTVNACRVDQELVEANYRSPSFFTDELVNVYGLDTIEYLLFRSDTANACPPQLPLNQGPWAALGEREIHRRRAEYAHIAALEVARRADDLSAAWAEDSGGFVTQFAEPGQAGAPYHSLEEALDQLFRALFYLDLVTKDRKLAALMAELGGECSQVTCPDQLESAWAGLSRTHIIANLDGARRIIFGKTHGEAITDAPRRGFHRLLHERGMEQVALDLDQALAGARAQAEALQVDLGEALLHQPEAVKALHAQLKSVTSLLKGPLVVALALKIPTAGAGDND